MKRLFCILLTIIILLCGCSSRYRTDITLEEIIEVYEDAGYNVASRIFDEKMESGQVAYVQADHPNGDYIYFAVFDSEKNAKAYENELDHPFMKLIFSFILGDAGLERMNTYGCIVVSYDDPNHFYPFEGLLIGK